MRKSRFSEEQIIGMIKEQETGLPTVEVCRKHGLSPATLRDELLNEELFDSLADARRKLAVWRYDYNNVRPHSSLQHRTPAQARRAFLQNGSVTPGALVPVGRHEYQTGRLSL